MKSLPKGCLAWAMVLSAALAGCDGSGRTTDDTDDSRAPLDFKVGDSRILLRELSAIGDSVGMRIYSLGAFNIAKDTVVGGYRGWIVESKVHDFEFGMTRTTRGRQLLLDKEGEVSVLEFRQDSVSGFLFGLLKEAAADTDVYSDSLVALRYPAEPGQKWRIRPENNPWESLSFERELTGLDTVRFAGKDYPCWVYTLHGFVPVKTWVSRIGLMKAEIDHGFMVLEDSLQGVTDTVPQKERYELLDMDPTRQEIDSLTAYYKARSGWIR